jgi:hypothetical protein
MKYPIILFLIVYPNSTFSCSLKLSSLRYEPVRSKSELQKQLRQEIRKRLNEPDCIPLLLKEGIIRRAEEIEPIHLRRATSLQYPLREITGFSDGLLLEFIESPSHHKKKLKISLNIEKYFKQVKEPQKNDLVVYIENNLKINFFGVYEGLYTIRSQIPKHPYILTHVLFNIVFFSDNDGAVFFRLKQKYQDHKRLIERMRKDNLKNILKIFYYNYFLQSKYSKDEFINLYSCIVSDKGLINESYITKLMKQYNWEKFNLLRYNTYEIANLIE